MAGSSLPRWRRWSFPGRWCRRAGPSMRAGRPIRKARSRSSIWPARWKSKAGTAVRSRSAARPTTACDRVDVTGSGRRTSIHVVTRSAHLWGSDGEAHLIVHVPAKSSLTVTLVSSDFKVTGVLGDLKVQTVSGKVSGEAGGDVRAATVSGNVRLKAPGRQVHRDPDHQRRYPADRRRRRGGHQYRQRHCRRSNSPT